MNLLRNLRKKLDRVFNSQLNILRKRAVHIYNKIYNRNAK